MFSQGGLKLLGGIHFCLLLSSTLSLGCRLESLQERPSSDHHTRSLTRELYPYETWLGKAFPLNRNPRRSERPRILHLFVLLRTPEIFRIVKLQVYIPFPHVPLKTTMWSREGSSAQLLLLLHKQWNPLMDASQDSLCIDLYISTILCFTLKANCWHEAHFLLFHFIFKD